MKCPRHRAALCGRRQTLSDCADATADLVLSCQTPPAREEEHIESMLFQGHPLMFRCKHGSLSGCCPTIIGALRAVCVFSRPFQQNSLLSICVELICMHWESQRGLQRVSVRAEATNTLCGGTKGGGRQHMVLKEQELQSSPTKGRQR